MIDVQMMLRIHCFTVQKNDKGFEWSTQHVIKSTRLCSFAAVPPIGAMFTIGDHPARYRIDRYWFREGKKDIDGDCLVTLGPRLQGGSVSPEAVREELTELGWDTTVRDEGQYRSP